MNHGTSVVKIIVGQDDSLKEYVIHKDLICLKSDFFKKAFTGSFREATESEIKLPEESPMAFEAFYEWLYTGQIREPVQYKYTNNEILPDVFWLRVLSMAGRHLVNQLQDLASDRIQKSFIQDRVPPPEFVQELFEDEMPRMRTLQRYLVQHCAFWLQAEKRTTKLKLWSKVLHANHRLAADVAVKMAEMTSGPLHPPNWHPAHCGVLSPEPTECTEDRTGNDVDANLTVQMKMEMYAPTCWGPLSAVPIPETENPICLHVVDQQAVYVHVSDTTTTADLKAKIQKETGTRAERQLLYFKRTILKDDCLLSEYDIRNWSEIRLQVVAGRGTSR